MDYFLCRAMEIGRMSPEQIEQLHNHEKKERLIKDFDPVRQEYKRTEARSRRCLMPYEIQAIFGLPTLKEHYQIPQDDIAAQEAHNRRLKADFRRVKIGPEHGDIPSISVEAIHAFDTDVLLALAENRINLFYMGGQPRKRRVTEQVEG